MSDFLKGGDILAGRLHKLHTDQGSAGFGGHTTERLLGILYPETADYAEAVQFMEEGVSGSNTEYAAILQSIFARKDGRFDIEAWKFFKEDFSCLVGIYYGISEDETKRMSPMQWEYSEERKRFNAYLIKLLEADIPLLRVSSSLKKH